MPSSPSSCQSEQDNSKVFETVELGGSSALPELKSDIQIPNMAIVMATTGTGTSMSMSRIEGQANNAHSSIPLLDGVENIDATMPHQSTNSAPSHITSSSQPSSVVIASTKAANVGSKSAADETGLNLSSSRVADTLLPKRACTHIKSMGEESEKNDDRKKEAGNDKDEESIQRMSIDKLMPTKTPRKRRTPAAKAGQTSGRWTQQEHQAFLEGLKECGREWKKVAMKIPTRTSAQIRSHAQKYFSKIQRDHEASALPEVPANVPRGRTSLVPQSGPLTPGVQQNVNRILANPSAAQQEVEHTLDALRERHRQLQLRLQERQRNRSFRQSQSLSPSKKRMRIDTDGQRSGTVASGSDDHSSVSSNISTSVASMGNDELIALSVLGSALPRSASNQQIQQMTVRSSESSDVSIASSTISAHNETIESDDWNNDPSRALNPP